MERRYGVEHGHGPRARCRGAPDKVIADLVTAGLGGPECDVTIDEALGVETVETQKGVLDQVHVGLAVVGMELHRPSEGGPVGCR